MSSSNDILDPDRQLSTYYQSGGIGSSNSDAELSALIDEGRSELDSDARAAIYQDAVQLAYDQAYFAWLVSNQDLYGLSERLAFDAASRFEVARQGHERDELSRSRGSGATARPWDATSHGDSLQGLVVIFGVTVFVFVVTRLIGDPVKFMLPLSATEEQRDSTALHSVSTQSIPRQFVDFLGDLVRLDLGESTYVRGQSALSVVCDYLPRTFQLVAFGMALAIVLSVPARLAGQPASRADRSTGCSPRCRSSGSRCRSSSSAVCC